jgi:hypothetical protein
MELGAERRDRFEREGHLFFPGLSKAEEMPATALVTSTYTIEKETA